MLAGMFVVWDGAPMQVTAIRHSSATLPGDPAQLVYHLVPLDGSHMIVVENPTAEAMPMTAPCDQCHRPAGFGTCVETGQCAGALPAAQPHPVAVTWSTLCGCCQCPECWSARQGRRELAR